MIIVFFFIFFFRPDVGVDRGAIYFDGDLSSVQAYVADNLIVLLKDFLRLNKLSKQNGTHETFIASKLACFSLYNRLLCSLEYCICSFYSY